VDGGGNALTIQAWTDPRLRGDDGRADSFHIVAALEVAIERLREGVTFIIVIPAKAGIYDKLQHRAWNSLPWVPTFVGMTE
jgi:hypothetical protein